MTPLIYRACKTAVHVITSEGHIIKGGQAAMFILKELGYPGWLVKPFTWSPLLWLTEWGYLTIANHRSLFARFLFTDEAGATIVDETVQKRLRYLLLMGGVMVWLSLILRYRKRCV